MKLYQHLPFTCPVCGGWKVWTWGVARHDFKGVKYVHAKFMNEGWVRLCLLKNGKAIGE